MILGLIFFTVLSANAQPLFLKEIPKNSGNFTGSNGKLYFFSGDSLWKSDATSGGTQFIKKLNEKVADKEKFTLGNFMYFTTTESGGKNGVWKTDGTASGTIKLGSFVSASPLLIYKNEIYFSLNNGVSGLELWKLNAANTFSMLKDINPGSGSSIDDQQYYPKKNILIISNNLLYFKANSGSATHLWKSDGTSAGTTAAVTHTFAHMEEFVDVNGTIYFLNVIGYSEYELWKTNGTNAGTVMIKKFASYDYIIYKLIAFKGKLYFFNNWSDFSDELWVCDGTEAGTKKLKEVGIDSYVHKLFATDNYLIFLVDNQGYTPGIWKSDGTSTGTVLFTPTNYNSNSFSPENLTTSGNLLFYSEHDGPSDYGSAQNPEDAYQLYQSGYELNNTKSVRKMFGSGEYWSSKNITDVNGKIFFTSPKTPDYYGGQSVLKLYYYDPAKPASSAPYFTLVNSDTDKDMAWLKEGDTIVKPAGTNINIRYNAVGTPGSVVFKLADTTRRVESGAPFTLAGDVNGNYSPWLEAKQGKHKLTAIPYSQSGGGGTAGNALTVNFHIKVPVPKQAPVVNAGPDQTIYLPKDSTVLTATASDADGVIQEKHWHFVSGPSEAYPSIYNWDGQQPLVKGLAFEGTYTFAFEAEDNDGNIGYDEMKVIVKPTSSGPRVDNFTLINADTDKDLEKIHDGGVIYLGTLPTQNLNIKINTTPGSVAKIVIRHNGGTRTETAAPYSVYGDNNGNFTGVKLEPGFYTLTATPYTSSGTEGAALTIRYELKAGKPNQPPVANAGPNFTVFEAYEDGYYSATFKIIGKASDPDGSVVSKVWNNISAPMAYYQQRGDTLIARVYQREDYWFRFTVTDDKGATAEDEVMVTMAAYPSQVAVKSFTLMNADNNSVIKTLNQGEIIDLSQMPTRNLDIRANIDSTNIRQVVFHLGEYYTQDYYSPYTFFGGLEGNYPGTSLTPGNYNLTAVPYNSHNIVGQSKSIQFKVIEGTSNQNPIVNAGSEKVLTLPANSTTLAGSATDSDGTISSYSWTKLSGPSATMTGASSSTLQLSNLVEGAYNFRLTATDNSGGTAYDEVTVTVQKSGQSVVSYTLMNADNDQPIRVLSNNETLDISTLPTKNLNIRINTNPAIVGSIKLSYDGATRMENGAPYSLFGDNNGDYKVANFTNGNHTLSATPYSGSNGSGTTGNSLTIFTLFASE